MQNPGLKGGYASMKRNQFALLLASVCAVAALGGCGKQIEMKTGSTSMPAEVVSDAALAPDPVDIDAGKKIIGTKSEVLSVRRMELENTSGQRIVGISVKNGDGSVDSGNLMTEGQVLELNETGVIYYDSEAAVMAAAGKNEVPVYQLSLTFESGEEKTVSDFPFNDTEACSLHYEDGIVFITYHSDTDDTDVSTKEREAQLQTPAVEPTETPAAESRAQTAAQTTDDSGNETRASRSSSATANTNRSQTTSDSNRSSRTQSRSTGNTNAGSSSSNRSTTNGTAGRSTGGGASTASPAGSASSTPSSPSGGSSSGNASGGSSTGGSSDGGNSSGGSTSAGGSSDGGSAGGSSSGNASGGSSDGGSSAGGSSDGGNSSGGGSSDGGGDVFTSED